MNKLAVYAGSFDLITIGHEWMIKSGAKLFDELVVAIGVNPDKKPLFSVEERITMLREVIGDLPPNIRITTFTNRFLIHYAQGVGASFILRGIRNPADYEFEKVMHNINRDLAPSIVTVFLMTPREIAEVSSSMVKGLIGPEGWEEIVAKYVPGAVFNKLKEKFSVNTNTG